MNGTNNTNVTLTDRVVAAALADVLAIEKSYPDSDRVSDFGTLYKDYPTDWKSDIADVFREKYPDHAPLLFARMKQFINDPEIVDPERYQFGLQFYHVKKGLRKLLSSLEAF